MPDERPASPIKNEDQRSEQFDGPGYERQEGSVRGAKDGFEDGSDAFGRGARANDSGTEAGQHIGCRHF